MIQFPQRVIFFRALALILVYTVQLSFFEVISAVAAAELALLSFFPGAYCRSSIVASFATYSGMHFLIAF